jgi:hypothetical protein
MIYELAEAPILFEVLAPGEERVEFEDAVIFFAHGNRASSCRVQRLRFDPENLERLVTRVRDVVRAKGRLSATWEVLLSVHQRQTVDRLLSLGMRPADPPLAVIMTALAEPRRPDRGIVVSSVDTVAEFKTHVAITHEVFGNQDQLPDELERIETNGVEKLADRTFVRYVARLNGDPAGAATATFTDAGVMLHSGSTLPRYRRRGVYTSMVHHRWLEAVARGTPHLITRAGPMSRPILRNLGFSEFAEVVFLVDSPS